MKNQEKDIITAANLRENIEALCQSMSEGWDNKRNQKLLKAMIRVHNYFCVIEDHIDCTDYVSAGT